MIWLAMLLAGSGRPAWSRDEAATAMVVRRPLAQVWRSWAFDPALEPFYLLINLWAEVSTSEFWLRLPPVMATAATLPVLATLTSRFCAPPAGILAALLFVLLPAASRYGQEARPYALTMLVATAVVLSWVTDRAVRGWAVQLRLVVLLVALGLLHAYALVLVLVLLTVALVAPETDRRQEVAAVLRTGALTLLALSPFLWFLIHDAVGDPHPAGLTPVNVAVELLRLPVGVLRPPAAPVFGAAAWALAICGVIVGWRRGGPARSGAVLAASWLVIPPAALGLGQAATDAPGLVARYWTHSLPAIGLAGAFVLQAVWSRRRVVAATLLIVVGFLGLPTQLAIRSAQGHADQGWRAIAALLLQPELSGAAVLVEGSVYRTLVANEPGLAGRMPLIVEPAPSGRIHPQIAGPASAQFRSMVTTYDVAVLLHNRQTPLTATPTLGDFAAFRAERGVFARPALMCTFFGDPLGIVTKPSAPLTPSQVQHLGRVITEIDPQQVRCVAHEGR
ncbi:MAG TPA: hypothetical protein VLJ88_10045 [Propionibacteriaceae bacterium]|nr:hypothetical protein [Propionibacteriaceae bacterium]